MSEQMYQMLADKNELEWFFDHVIQRPQVNESYSAVFVSRHKKLTDEEAKEFGVTRRDAEFLNVQTFKLRSIKDGSSQNDPTLWTFEQFLQRLKRFNVDKGAFTTSTGCPIPDKTLAVIFYVNPCDDMKVCKKFVDEYNLVNEGIAKAMLGGKSTADNYQSYQWFGKADSTIKHFKANCKGSRYWMDFDIDVPSWFKSDPTPFYEGFMEYGKQHANGPVNYEDFKNGWLAEHKVMPDYYYNKMREVFTKSFGRGNYVIVDTCGGYHVLVRTCAIKSDPHDICGKIIDIYTEGIANGNDPYVDEKGTCKFECVINDSQIPGLPLPGTYQYGRPVTVLNKEDFEDIESIQENQGAKE